MGEIEHSSEENNEPENSDKKLASKKEGLNSSQEEEISPREKNIQEFGRKMGVIDEVIFDKAGFDMDKITYIQERKLDLKEKLLKIGLNPEHYLYWHILLGSGIKENSADSMPLDTENGDIEKLLNELIPEKKDIKIKD